MNRLFQMMQQSPMPNNNFIQQFQNFARTFQGNPQQIVQNLMQSGRVTQAQYDQAVNIANQLTGIFILRGNTPNCFAQYQVTFNGNIAIPTGGTVGPIAVALALNGEPRLTSRGVFTPAAVDQYGNVTSTAIVRVPRGCCFSLSLRAVPGTDDPAATLAPVINLQNANLTIVRTA
jgi:hypothetical protein